MEVGFFPFGTHTYGYTIVGEPDESDVAIMLSNIHGLDYIVRLNMLGIIIIIAIFLIVVVVFILLYYLLVLARN